MSNVERVIDFAGALTAMVGWLSGIVLANGALSTAIAVWIPPYAWYLVVDKMMMLAGIA